MEGNTPVLEKQEQQVKQPISPPQLDNVGLDTPLDEQAHLPAKLMVGIILALGFIGLLTFASITLFQLLVLKTNAFQLVPDLLRHIINVDIRPIFSW